MLLDYADIELLRLAGWCKNLPVALPRRFSANVFDAARIRLLQDFGLLYAASSGEFYRLRPAGFALLSSLGLDCPQDSKYVSEEKTLRGREQAAYVMLAFHRAGFHIYLDSQGQLESDSFLPFAAIRRSKRKDNPFPGLSLIGAGRTALQTLACYYPDEGCICLGNEKTVIDKLAAGTAGRCLLYCGSSYLELARAILESKADTARRRNVISYAEAYERSPYPVCLMECSDTGAAQLLLASQPDYRVRLAKLALGCRYSPPPQDMEGADALFQGKYPVLICIDMDMGRIQALCRTVQQKGYPNVIVIAFKEQLSAIAGMCASARPELFGTSWESALRHFGLKLYDPPLGAYPIPGGGYLDATLVKAARKTRKLSVQENKA